MNKQELIERMAGKTGMAKKDCGIALDGKHIYHPPCRQGKQDGKSQI